VVSLTVPHSEPIKRRYDPEKYRLRRATDPSYVKRCRDASREAHRQKKARGDKSDYWLRREQGLCPICTEPVSGFVRCASCRADAVKAQRSLLSAILDHYGRSCACCGEPREAFLTLDHINNDGSAQRKQSSSTAWRFTMARRALKTGQWPADLQTLCFNCNCGRERNGGVCPHQDDGTKSKVSRKQTGRPAKPLPTSNSNTVNVQT
jgi:hypothetical protein